METKQQIKCTIDREGNFTITGKAFPEKLTWAKNGKPIETNYLYHNTDFGEKLQVLFEGIPVNVSVKLTMPSLSQVRVDNHVAVPMSALIAEYKRMNTKQA